MNSGKTTDTENSWLDMMPLHEKYPSLIQASENKNTSIQYEDTVSLSSWFRFF